MDLGKIVLGGLFLGLAVMAKQPNKTIQPQPIYRRSRKKITAETPPSELPDYDLSDVENLNEGERAFREYLDEVRQLYPDDYKIIVKKREPMRNENGFLEYAFVVKKGDKNEVYMVIPKIDNTKRLTYAIHETCHLKHFHQDPNKLGGQLDPYTKELEVEICMRNWFEGPWKYGRPMIEILNNYYTG